MKRRKDLCEEKVKEAPTYNNMNTSGSVQNRMAMWRTIDSEKDATKETTRFFKRVRA